MKISRLFKTLISTAVMTFVSFAAPTLHAAPSQEGKVLNIYNWSDYIADDTLKNFEKETGIKVRYDTYDNNEILHAKLTMDSSDYDIVVPSSTFGGVQIEAALLQKLDKKLLPNYSHLDPLLQSKLKTVDANNQYLVTWLWGFTTVGINTKKVQAALGSTKIPDNLFELMFNPDYAKKLKSCGISVLESPTELIPSALIYLKKDAYSQDKNDYKEVSSMLSKVRPYISLFSSSGYINDLANGTICVALGWNGDINIAKQKAIDTKKGQTIQTFIPPKDALLFLDTMAIPKNAPHPNNAHLFINYMLRPDVAGALTNKTKYANPSRDSLKYISPDLAQNESLFATAKNLETMREPQLLTNELRRYMTKAFKSFKAGLNDY